VAALAKELEKRMRFHRAPTMGDITIDMVVLPCLPVPGATPLARRPGAKYRTVEE